MNKLTRIKELISRIAEADQAYFGEDKPIMTDREYDLLVEELQQLEKETGIVFANSPTKKTGGANRQSLKKVAHTKPMLSAKKTKSREEMALFAAGRDVILSWKLDGFTLVLRYDQGRFVQALTRGEDGLTGEDVTGAVRFMRNVPKRVTCKERFEVRGEGVIAWADYRLLNRNAEQGHPRNVAAQAVRQTMPDRGVLEHLDFIAFELIRADDESKTKKDQLNTLSMYGFDVVDHVFVAAEEDAQALSAKLDGFDPENMIYPVDGIIAEYDDLAYGRSLGATAHHENRMLALKWSDDLYETVFRRVELATTRNGKIALTAVFDPVTIDGTKIERADLHSLSNYEKYRLGAGDMIRVYKANMIIPQIAENLTRSATYALPEFCPCCGERLETRVSSGGSKNLYCPNETCIARNAQKIARFCDTHAMGIECLNATVLEKLMAYGVVKTYADLYDLKNRREKILAIPGMGYGSFMKMVNEVETSRRCHLSQFLTGIGIPLMGPTQARAIDEYFYGSWEAFEKAVNEEFRFNHIAGVSPKLSGNIYAWYHNAEEEKHWRAVLKEITFIGQNDRTGKEGNLFCNANVVVTGIINGMNRADITELLHLLGANVTDTVTKQTAYLIAGESPGAKKLSDALTLGTQILTQSRFAKMLAETEIGDGAEKESRTA